MWMNIAVIGILAIYVMATSSQGFFSAVLQFAGTVAAGAVAFALWEPAYYFLFGKLDKAWGYDIGWGVSLIITFAIFRLIFLMLSDKACPANVFLTDAANTVGSGAVGLMSATITAGIILIGIQFIQGPTKMLGYQAWTLDNDGSVIRQDTLWIPVDEIVEFIYSQGSLGAMYSTNPLAEWQPELTQQASLYRTSYGDGASRMGMRPDGYEVKRMFRITPSNPDQFFRNLPGTINPETGRAFTDGDVYGIRVAFNNSTTDSDGRLRLSKGQIRLIVEMPDGKFLPVFPHAFYLKYQQDLPFEARFEFDVGDVYASSVGVGAEINMGFEFVIPAGARVHHLLIRNARTVLTSIQPEDISENALDALITSGRY